MLKRHWAAFNLAVIGATVVYGALFMMERREGSFSGRVETQWTALPPAPTTPDGFRLRERACREEACEREFVLLVPRSAWLSLDRACLTDAPDTCFAGDRNDFRARLTVGTATGVPVGIRLAYRSGATAIVKFGGVR